MNLRPSTRCCYVDALPLSYTSLVQTVRRESLQAGACSVFVCTVAILSVCYGAPGNYSNETQNLSSLVTALNSIPLIGGVYETT